MLWLRVPEKIYFKKGCLPVALRELRDVMGKKRAFIVTDKRSYTCGKAARVEGLLDEMDIQHTVYYDLKDVFTVADAAAGARAARLFEPDVIIAVGAGVAINAAKLIRLKYECPEADIPGLSERFGDIRNSAELFPRTNLRAALAAVPDASGMGDEMTPYASAAEGDKSYVVADYELMPEFAVIDPDIMASDTKEEIAQAAKKAVVRLLSAYGSEYASEYTDGFVIKALDNILSFIPEFIKGSGKAPADCEGLTQAFAMTGIAYANTGLCGEKDMKTVLDDILRVCAEDERLLARYASLGRALKVTGEDDRETAAHLISKLQRLADMLR